MRSEADLGKWLETLTSGRASSAFAEDVADTSSVLRQAAASLSAPLRVVSLTWPEVPPLANELGLLVSALAEAVPDFFPVLYGRSQERAPAKWSQSFIESEAHAITRLLPDVQGTACRKILSAAQRGETPSLGKLAHAEQARQLALAIEPDCLLVVIAVLATPAAREQLKSLAQGAEWLASNTASRVALILPRELATRHELDHVTYGACVLADGEAENAPAPGVKQNGDAGPAERKKLTKVALESQRPPPGELGRVPKLEVSAIEGRPAKRSEAEQILYRLITDDAKLRLLFGYNRRVNTSGGTPIVDLLWDEGKLVIEIDGPDHLRKQKYSSDRVRDLQLLLQGYRVVRFTEGSVIEKTDWVMEQIRETVRYCSKRGTK